MKEQTEMFRKFVLDPDYCQELLTMSLMFIKNDPHFTHDFYFTCVQVGYIGQQFVSLDRTLLYNYTV